MSIKSLLNQSVTIYNRSGYGADGEFTYSTGTSVDSRFEAKTKRVLLPNGDILAIDAFVIVGPDVTVNTNDKITYGSDDYRVVDIFAVPDDTGDTHHKELGLAKWPST